MQKKNLKKALVSLLKEKQINNNVIDLTIKKIVEGGALKKNKSQIRLSSKFSASGSGKEKKVSPWQDKNYLNRNLFEKMLQTSSKVKSNNQILSANGCCLNKPILNETSEANLFSYDGYIGYKSIVSKLSSANISIGKKVRGTNVFYKKQNWQQEQINKQNLFAIPKTIIGSPVLPSGSASVKGYFNTIIPRFSSTREKGVEEMLYSTDLLKGPDLLINKKSNFYQWGNPKINNLLNRKRKESSYRETKYTLKRGSQVKNKIKIDLGTYLTTISYKKIILEQRELFQVRKIYNEFSGKKTHIFEFLKMLCKYIFSSNELKDNILFKTHLKRLNIKMKDNSLSAWAKVDKGKDSVNKDKIYLNNELTSQEAFSRDNNLNSNLPLVDSMEDTSSRFIFKKTPKEVGTLNLTASLTKKVERSVEKTSVKGTTKEYVNLLNWGKNDFLKTVQTQQTQTTLDTFPFNKLSAPTKDQEQITTVDVVARLQSVPNIDQLNMYKFIHKIFFSENFDEKKNKQTYSGIIEREINQNEKNLQMAQQTGYKTVSLLDHYLKNLTLMKACVNEIDTNKANQKITVTTVPFAPKSKKICLSLKNLTLLNGYITKNMNFTPFEFLKTISNQMSANGNEYLCQFAEQTVNIKEQDKIKKTNIAINTRGSFKFAKAQDFTKKNTKANPHFIPSSLDLEKTQNPIEPALAPNIESFKKSNILKTSRGSLDYKVSSLNDIRLKQKSKGSSTREIGYIDNNKSELEQDLNLGTVLGIENIFLIPFVYEKIQNTPIQLPLKISLSGKDLSENLSTNLSIKLSDSLDSLALGGKEIKKTYISTTSLILLLNRLIHKKSIEFIFNMHSPYSSIFYLKYYWLYLYNYFYPTSPLEKFNLQVPLSITPLSASGGNTKKILSSNKHVQFFKTRCHSRMIFSHSNFFDNNFNTMTSFGHSASGNVDYRKNFKTSLAQAGQETRFKFNSLQSLPKVKMFKSNSLNQNEHKPNWKNTKKLITLLSASGTGKKKSKALNLLFHNISLKTLDSNQEIMLSFAPNRVKLLQTDTTLYNTLNLIDLSF